MTNGSLKRKRRAGAAGPARESLPAASGARTIAVTEDEAGMRLDRWFKRRMPSLSLSHLNKIVRTGQVRVDGARVKTAARLAAGQNVRVPPLTLGAPTARTLRRAPSADDARALRDMTLFEDRNLLILNKPFGLAVQGGSGTTRHIDGMLEALADERGERPRLVHRLDRDTSGVLLVAKSRAWPPLRRNLPLAPPGRSTGPSSRGSQAGTGPHLAVPGQSKAWAKCGAGRVTWNHPRRPPWRDRRAALRLLLRDRR